MRFAGVLVLVTALTLAGCTKADSPTVAGPTDGASVVTGPSTGDSGTVPSESPSDLLSPSNTVAPSTSAPSTTAPSTPAPTTTAPTTTTPTTTAPVAVGCAASALSVSVERGSGVAGHQYATIIFENKSSTSCPLAGFPGVQLLAAGKAIGSSVRSGTAKTVTLAPGASAQSALVNNSTCGAADSDSIQIIAPNTSTPVVLPLVFRGCTVTVGPVQAA